MKLKCKLEMVSMGDEIIGVPIGEYSNTIRGVLKLNKEGKAIIELLNSDTSEDIIVKDLSSRYEIDRENLITYVRSVIDILNKNKLLVY